MERIDLEFEKLLIAKSIGLSFHGLDFVVHAFQGARRNGMAEPVHDSPQTSHESACELLCTILDPRWHIDPSKPDARKRLNSAFGFHGVVEHITRVAQLVGMSARNDVAHFLLNVVLRRVRCVEQAHRPEITEAGRRFWGWTAGVSVD